MKIYFVQPRAKNVNLIKNDGMVLYLLMKEHNYDPYFICYNDDEYTYLDNEVKGLKLDFLEEKYGLKLLNEIRFVRKNARDMDVFRRFHCKFSTISSFLIYKLLNRKGITFLTLDIPFPATLKLTGHDKAIKNQIKTRVLVFLFKYLFDFATIETKKSYDLFVNFHEIYQEKLLYVPPFIDLDSEIKKDKKNQILCVGRIGSHQKASDIVLESFKQAVEKLGDNDWTLKMVGPIKEDFNEYIEEFFDKNPDMKDRIIFTGNIGERKKLYELYAESKIFYLPSRCGSFEIVFAEALFYEDYLLISDVGVADYLINISNYGQLVEIDNIEDNVNKLVEAINNYDEYSNNKKIDLKELVHNEFSYGPYIDLIDERIKELKK